ncbi:MAG TPA: recombinase family protein [Terracidiphilus sp.]|nr:recombinase family protein [Terracidiphilus sp.]
MNRLSEKTSRRMKAAFDGGRWTRGAPIGYQSAGIKIKGKPNLIPHPEEAKFIVMAFELVAAGHDRPTVVLRNLAELGLRSNKGKKLMHHTFTLILRNPFYMGMMRSKTWGRNKGLHEPLISELILAF